MKIAIMGFGTVGSGAYETAMNAGGIEVVKILARHGREGYEFLNDIITPDIDDIAGDPEIELVIESIGGIDPAREYVLKCLRAGKHVVTPNKNLISACYKELMDEAAKHDISENDLETLITFFNENKIKVITDEEEAEDEQDDSVIYEANINNGSKNDRNPATGGLPFMTAGLVSVAAAGVAYLTKKRNLENGTTR